MGVFAGIAFLLFISNTGVKVIQTLAQLPSGQPAVTLAVQEDYLNSEASKQINGSYPTGVDGLTVTALQIDVGPDNRLDLRAEFKVDVGFFNFATSAAIANRISAQDGRIVINMQGQPQLGDLTVPIDMLPFNLSERVTSAVNRVNNDVIAAELNGTLDANLRGTNLYLDAITTDMDSLTLHMKQR